jgi:hypothetical protein
MMQLLALVPYWRRRSLEQARTIVTFGTAMSYIDNKSTLHRNTP